VPTATIPLGMMSERQFDLEKWPPDATGLDSSGPINMFPCKIPDAPNPDPDTRWVCPEKEIIGLPNWEIPTPLQSRLLAA